MDDDAPQSAPPKAKGRPLWVNLTIVGGVVLVWFCLGVLILYFGKFRTVYAPKTGAQVSPEAVTFLKLPPTAWSIGFWDDGYQQEATFHVPEADFAAIFPELTFKPIREPVSYGVWVFGEPKQGPQKTRGSQTATYGLVYEVRWSNGGGRKVVYDRARQFCSYELVRW